MSWYPRVQRSWWCSSRSIGSPWPPLSPLPFPQISQGECCSSILFIQSLKYLRGEFPLNLLFVVTCAASRLFCPSRAGFVVPAGESGHWVPAQFFFSLHIVYWLSFFSSYYWVIQCIIARLSWDASAGHLNSEYTAKIASQHNSSSGECCCWVLREPVLKKCLQKKGAQRSLKNSSAKIGLAVSRFKSDCLFSNDTKVLPPRVAYK